MKIEDERTTEEKRTHTVIVVGVDTFLSGWGECEGATSYAAWACRPEDKDRVFDWVRGRSDMEGVKIKDRDYIPPMKKKSRDHYHVYVVGENHRALQVEI